MQRTLRFLLGHELQEISACDPQTTVLEWLRGKEGRKGTKEGCAEGDCGACTVTVVELQGSQLRYRAINSCIQFLPMLDGKQLLTVEDLASAEPTNPRLHLGLHPVQQAMVDQHGSQCGFCTPGFVMSLFTLFHDPRDLQATAGPDRQDIDEVLAGNLCRCTGYAPIVKAARQAMQLAPAGDDFTAHEPATVRKLQQIAHEETLALEFQGRRFFAPRSLQALCGLLSEHPSATLVAGATDLGLWVTKQLQQPPTLIYVGEVQELKRLEVDASTAESTAGLEIGAAVRYADSLGALISIYPEMAELLKRLGAEQVRNAGTIGGNIANGSPIGDMPPALIALDARLILTSVNGRRELPLEDFFIEYGKQDLHPGECVEAIRIPPRPAGLQYAVYKLSRRRDQDISSLCGAFSMRIADGKVTEPRICFGGMAGIPKRAEHAEQALAGQAWNLDTVSAAQQALQTDYQPLNDWRGSREYRMQAAQNLLQRFYLETQNTAGTRLQRGVA